MEGGKLRVCVSLLVLTACVLEFDREVLIRVREMRESIA